MESHGLANRPGEPYPATFRISVEPPRIELGSPPRQGGVVPLDHEPVTFSGPAGESNSDLLVAGQASSRWTSSPLDSFLPEVRPGIEPGLPPYHGGVLPKHLQTDSFFTVIPDRFELSLSWLSPRCLYRWTTGSMSQ